MSTSTKTITVGGTTSVPWHARLEGKPLAFTLWTTVAVAVGGLFELVPSMAIESNVPTIDAVRPYTPLELVGRDVYVSEGCVDCHSQMVRPFREEALRHGEYAKAGEHVSDRPWGSRRIGPDLLRVGGKYPDMWHYDHVLDPRSTSPGSLMPEFRSRRREPPIRAADKKSAPSTRCLRYRCYLPVLTEFTKEPSLGA